MLDTAFPRPVGDIGNPETFPFPVAYRTVPGATAERIVADAASARAMLPAFIEAAQSLEAEGCRALATSCGFLACVQRELAASVAVPVATSALCLLALLRALEGQRPIGVITADARCLGAAHLEGVGATPEGLHIRGMEGSAAFGSAILAPPGTTPSLDRSALAADLLGLCATLKADVPDLAALVFECTNLQPYASSVQAATGLPIFGIAHLVRMLHEAAGEAS